ncbi:hypothetical protein SNUCP2_04510 [Clostridium perfringens A]
MDGVGTTILKSKNLFIRSVNTIAVKIITTYSFKFLDISIPLSKPNFLLYLIISIISLNTFFSLISFKIQIISLKINFN